jgi:putative transposase
MLLTKKIKLNVTEQDAATLEFMQGKCRGLYNWWVMKLREGEKWHFSDKKRMLKESKAFDPELNQVYGKLLVKVHFRLDQAIQAFFRRVRAGETPTFPRVRPRHCFFTLCYPTTHIAVQGDTLILPTGEKGKKKFYPNVEAQLTETPPEDFQEVAISRDAIGNYYACFTSQVEEHEQEVGQVAAFDLGIKTLATGVNEQGRFYHIGGFRGHQWYNKQLEKLKLKRNRCKKKSRRYIYLSKVYQRISKRKRNKQRDSLHKASHLIAQRLVERTIVVGDLSQKPAVKKASQERNKRLERPSFREWGLYIFTEMLEYKCQRYGKAFVLLDERNTSKACSNCGVLQTMPLYKRTYCCTNCGLVMDRDENSAVNILTRYLARLGPYTHMQECDVLQKGQNSKEASCAPQMQ